jgi:Pilus formation protein N terminal region
MAALCARGRAKSGRLHWLSAALLLIAIAAPAAAGPANPEDTIVVFLDQARLLQLPDRAVNVVIGNPLVADLSIQAHGLAVITGKGYGATNFIVTDKKGVVLMEKLVEVTVPAEKTVVVYRGADRETYSCTPDCSRRFTLGDSPEYFDKTLSEIVSRNAQAAGAGATSTGH